MQHFIFTLNPANEKLKCNKLLKDSKRMRVSRTKLINDERKLMISLGKLKKLYNAMNTIHQKEK